MPTYVYRCENGHTFELFHSISDDSPRPCPTCGAGSKRVPAGGAGLLFKGSGFYITDYRSKGYEESAKRESGSGTTPAAGSEGAPAAPKPESAPAPVSGKPPDGPRSAGRRKAAGGARSKGTGDKSGA